MSEELDGLTLELGRVYANYKDYDKQLNGTKGKDAETGLKQRFFDEATKAQTTTLAQKTIRVGAAECNEAPEIYATKRYPRWIVKSVEYYDGTQDYDVLIEENPELKPFTYINQLTEIVWTKQVVDGSPWLDDVELQELDPELWDEVSEIPNFETLRDLVYECGVEPDEVDEHIIFAWRAYGGPRVFKGLDALDPDQLAAIQRFIYPGKPQVKLQAPRKAKPEELSDDG